jgi:hypothetical protein
MHLNITMETPSGALDVMQNSFDTVVTPIKRVLHDYIMKVDKNEKEVLDSKGDITKIKRFETSLKILRLLTKDKNKLVARRAGQVLRLYDHISNMKISFIQGYHSKSSLNGSFVWGTYIIYVQYIAVCTSHLIALQSGFMKKESYALSDLDNQIKHFANGDMQKWCDFFIKKKKNEAVKEDAGIIVGVVLLGVVITVAFFLRVLVFYFYFSRMQLSDYFNQQSDYFNIHASEIKKSGMDSAQKDAVLKAQKTWAERFTTLSELVVVDDLKSARKSKDFVKVANKEVNPSKIDVPNVGMDFI